MAKIDIHFPVYLWGIEEDKVQELTDKVLAVVQEFDLDEYPHVINWDWTE